MPQRFANNNNVIAAASAVMSILRVPRLSHRRRGTQFSWMPRAPSMIVVGFRRACHLFAKHIRIVVKFAARRTQLLCLFMLCVTAAWSSLRSRQTRSFQIALTSNRYRSVYRGAAFLPSYCCLCEWLFLRWAFRFKTISTIDGGTAGIDRSTQDVVETLAATAKCLEITIKHTHKHTHIHNTHTYGTYCCKANPFHGGYKLSDTISRCPINYSAMFAMRKPDEETCGARWLNCKEPYACKWFVFALTGAE